MGCAQVAAAEDGEDGELGLGGELGEREGGHGETARMEGTGEGGETAGREMEH